MYQTEMHTAQQPSLKTVDEMVECFERKNDVKKYVKKTLFVKVIDMNWYSNKYNLTEIHENTTIIHSPESLGGCIKKEGGSKTVKSNKTKVTRIAKKPLSLKTQRRIARRKEQKIVETEIRKLSWGIRKSIQKNQIFAVMRKLHQQEKKLCIMIERHKNPVFNVVSSSDVKG